jgi:hypothetical protein
MKKLKEFAEEIHKKIKNGASVADVMLLLHDFEDQNWISVNEYLPADRNYVLTKNEYGVTLTEFSEGNNGKILWWAITCPGAYEDGQIVNKVTHWRPIPNFNEFLITHNSYCT